jgi:hypothetical protein
LILALILLFCIYLPTVQAIINGSADPYAEDVAEIQTSLNLWGTIHATGYPLYAMIGAAFVQVAKAFGVSPALAPSLYSVVWTFIALSLFYTLIVKLTGRTGVAAMITLLLGLTRGVWAYSVVAKPYSMTLAFSVLLLLLALWPGVESPRRVLLLALAGGFAVAHHRMLAFMAPGLLIAALPPLFRDRWRILPTFALAVPVVAIGFLPYLYLPIRAATGAPFVYGNPTTLQGFMDEFTAKEAGHLFVLPGSAQAWAADALDTLTILLSQLTLVGVLAGVSALVILVPRRRLARTAALCGVGFLIFLLIYHRVVMPTAVMLPVVMILMFLVALALNDLLTAYREAKVWAVALPTLSIVSVIGLIGFNFGGIYAMTHDQGGLHVIALARTVPRDGPLMLPWSTRYNAVAFSKYVTGENADLALVNHTADFARLAGGGAPIYTFAPVFYRFPLAWWDKQIGTAYLSSPTPDIVRISNQPALQLFEPRRVLDETLGVYAYRLTCAAGLAHLEVTWAAQRVPSKAYHVFVHLLQADVPENAPPLATGDQSNPIYGWYPTTRWGRAEQVVDQYTVPLRNEAMALRFGLYEQTAAGTFVNYPAATLQLADYGCLTNPTPR